MRTALWRRPFGLLLLPLALIVCSFSGSERADADGSRHPYFNDQGTLRWFHTFAQAKAAAQREGKLIFIEYGRKRCSNCRKLAENVLPTSRIRGRMGSMAIGLAAECDTPEREVWTLFRHHLPNARSLPFVAFVTPRGRWITGWAGYTSESELVRRMDSAQVTLDRILAKRKRDAAEPSQPRTSAQPSREAASGQTSKPSASATTPEPRMEPKAEPMLRAGSGQRTPCTPPATPAPRPCDEPRGGAKPCDPCDPCADGSCDYDPCRHNPFANLFKKRCKPCPPKGAVATKPAAVSTPTKTKPAATSPAREPAVAVGSPDAGMAPSIGTAPRVATQGSDYPRPHERVAAPKRVLAEGSPDAQSFPPPAVQPQLPKPTVTTARKPAVAARVEPATQPRVAKATIPKTAPKPATASDPASIAAAMAAADRGDWAKVLELSRGMTKADQPVLFELNRQAHAWAHKELARAVRHIRARRYTDARSTVTAVKTAMLGEPEAVDAERGAEAIELMRDIDPLPKQSLVRRTVRKTAYEQMRGTRWAPLFSPVPQAGAAVATK